MKLYRVFICFVFLGLLAGAAYSQTDDPGIILRGDGASELVTTPTFGGAFQTMTGEPFLCASAGDGSNTNCFQNGTGTTFIALHLFLTPTNPSLPISCGNNSLDPFFQNCFVTPLGGSITEITFSGLGSSDGCGGVACKGIQNSDHFLLGMVDINGNPDLTDTATYSALADLATPEPASALLFVIGMGAIALFLKRA